MAYFPSRKLWLSCMRTLQALISTLLLASMVVARWAEPPSGGYRFELTHVDANRGFSNDELMRRAVDRSRLRAATLYGTHATHSAASSDSPIVSPAYLNKDAAEYFMTFYMGKPLQKNSPIYAVADTGSNLIWTVDKVCRKSKTISELPCSSDMCQNHANCRCRRIGNQKRCEYSIKYGGSTGTQTEGFLYKDDLTFPMTAPSLASGRHDLIDDKTFPDVAIGCSQDASISGIVGLGRGAQSLPGQLNFKKFSYCLNTYSRPELPSKLLFRTVPDLKIGAKSGATIATTGLRRKTHETWYFVDLQGISIDGTRHDVTLQSGATGGNMFVDSGASYTILEENDFNWVVEKVDLIMDRQSSKRQAEKDPICYSSSAHPDEMSLPQMVLHFADSADMVLPWNSYFWHDTEASTLCLTINKSEHGMLVLGNYQQQNIHMMFDTENEKLSFVPADCSEV